MAARTKGVTPKHLEKYAWKPGQTGNPLGKQPKGATLNELKMLARGNMPAAVERLKALIQSTDERIAFEAVQFTYLYAFGKPQEGSDVSHQEARQARYAELEAVPVHAELPAPEAEPEPVATPEVSVLTAPESPEAADVSPIVSAPSGLSESETHSLRCLYRDTSGQCAEIAPSGIQWCATHQAKLFSMVPK